jgi:hypothetical protein
VVRLSAQSTPFLQKPFSLKDLGAKVSEIMVAHSDPRRLRPGIANTPPAAGQPPTEYDQI